MAISFYKRSAAGKHVINITGDIDGATAVIINVSDVSKLVSGMPVSGAGIPVGSSIVSIDSTTQITIDNNTTTPGIGVALEVNSGSDLITLAIWELNDNPLAEDTDDPLSHIVWALNDNWRSIADQVITNYNKFADYYTAAQLDGGQLNTIYYTQAQIDAMIAAENLWDRVGTTLYPHTLNDSINTGSGDFTTTGNIYASLLTLTNNIVMANNKTISWGGGDFALVSDGATYIQLNGIGNISFACNGNLTFDDQYLSAAIPVSEIGQAGLDGSFVSSSIVGALNELKGTVGTGYWIKAAGIISPIIATDNLDMLSGYVKGGSIQSATNMVVPELYKFTWDYSSNGNYIYSGSDTVFVKAVDLIALQDGHLTDPINLAASGITGLDTTNKTIIGAINEINGKVIAESLWNRSGSDLVPQVLTDNLDLSGSSFKMGASVLSFGGGFYENWQGNGDYLNVYDWAGITLSTGSGNVVLDSGGGGSILLKSSGNIVWEILGGTTSVFYGDTYFFNGTFNMAQFDFTNSQLRMEARSGYNAGLKIINQAGTSELTLIHRDDWNSNYFINDERIYINGLGTWHYNQPGVDKDFIMYKIGGTEAMRYDAGLSRFEYNDDIYLAGTEYIYFNGVAGGNYRIHYDSGSTGIEIRTPSEVLAVRNGGLLDWSGSGLRIQTNGNTITQYGSVTGYQDRMELTADSAGYNMKQHIADVIAVSLRFNTSLSAVTIPTGSFIPRNDMYFLDSGSGLPFGEISCKGGSTSIDLPTAGTYVLMTNFDTDGASNQCTNDSTTNNRITVSRAGIYKVSFTASFSGTVSATFYIGVFKNGAIQNNIHVSRKLGIGGDVGCVSASGYISMAVNDYIDLRATGGTNGDDIVIQDANLNLVQVGG